MANQKSYNQIIDFLSGFSSNHLQLKTFGTGFRFDLNTAQTLTNSYPLLYVQPTSHQVLNWVQTYSLRIYCLDIKEKDSSNEQDIISDCLQILNDLFKYIQNNVNQITDFDYQIVNQPFSVPVTNYGVEFASGWYADIDLQVTLNDTDCDIPLVTPPSTQTNYYVAGCERMEYHIITYTGTSTLSEATIVNNFTPECWYIISATTEPADVGVVNQIFNTDGDCVECIPPTIDVFSQVLDFISPPFYNSLGYECDGNRIESCFSPGNYDNITDLVDLFNTGFPDPPNPSCTDPTFCFCWTDYGTYYDNGDGRIRCEMPVSVYNTLCSGGTLTLIAIYD